MTRAHVICLCVASVWLLIWSPVSEMSLAQRVLLTWVFTLVFLIILVLKLDGKVTVFTASLATLV